MSGILLYGANGARLQERETIELPWGVMQRVIEFADIMNLRHVGIHCSKCKEDFVASNADHAPVLKMSCGCREFWSTNGASRRH